MAETGTDKRILHCDTCGVETEHLHRDVLDENYDAMMKPPMWNCESCYRKKRTMRIVEGPVEIVLDRQIFLTGFMASGKSKVGPLIAHVTNRPYRDTDEMLVEEVGKSIPEIFAQDGEGVFRDLEHEAVSRASEMDDAVVSLGGGAILADRNWEAIGSSGVCLCLEASAETIYKRVTREETERPLLAGLGDAGRLEKIERMLEERVPFYGRADLFVTSREEKTPEETAAEAVEKLKAYGGRA